MRHYFIDFRPSDALFRVAELDELLLELLVLEDELVLVEAVDDVALAANEEPTVVVETMNAAIAQKDANFIIKLRFNQF